MYHTLSQQCQQNQNSNIEIHETFEAFYAKLVISELLAVADPGGVQQVQMHPPSKIPKKISF